MKYFVTKYPPTANNIVTHLSNVFDIMQAFKFDLLKAGNPIKFIKYNLLDKGMLPVHAAKNCTYNEDNNITYGDLKTANGYTAIEIKIDKTQKGTTCNYLVFSDKYNSPNIYVYYNVQGKPTELSFCYDNLPAFLNNVFCNIGAITNKYHYEINLDNYIINIDLDGDLTNICNCYASIDITLKI